MYYLYVLESEKDKSLYIGITGNLKKRLESHNLLENISTKSHAPYKMKFCMIFPDKYKAAKFEKYLKSASGKAFLNKRLI